MRIAVYPGTFDPVTKGHLYVVERSAKIFDHVVVAVLVNLKKEPLFSVEERMKFIADSVSHLSNVSVDHFSGLLVHFLQERQARFIIRGLRFVSDLETELQMASMNKDLMPDVETIFIPTHHEFSYLSSSIVKEVAHLGGDVSRFVPNNVLQGFAVKYADSKR